MTRGPRTKAARPAVYALHAQQAVEKFLKSVLVAHDADPPRTHDIRELSGLIDARTPHELPEHLYYPAIELTKDEAEAATNLARDISDWTLDTLGMG